MTTEAGRMPEIRIPSGADSFVERLAQRLGVNAGATAVYAPPVERDGVTVIGVAKARWGFGGGSGTQGAEQSGAGGGGGVSVTPVGYIEIKDGGAEFKRIKDPGSLIMVAPIIVAAGFTTWLALAGLRRLVRG